MNQRRLARLFQEQARISAEIARELDGEAGDSAEDAPERKPKKARRRARKITELDMQAARNKLRRLGVAV